ncbi:hypothetical protein D3C81_1526470 [compost metagenome]
MRPIEYNARRAAYFLQPSSPERILEAFQHILVLQHERHILTQNLQRHHSSGRITQLMLAFHGDAYVQRTERSLKVKALYAVLYPRQIIAEIFSGQIEG